MYRVIETTEHNQPTVHVFASENMFISWITELASHIAGAEGDRYGFDPELWKEAGVFTDGNHTTWWEFNVPLTHDHTISY